MDFTAQEIEEFKTEADELLEAAEVGLLATDKEPLGDHYDSIFRALHSIKGAAGMMGMTALQAHMHQLETIFTEQKNEARLAKELADFFLRGLDGCRALLRGEEISFDYQPSRTVIPLKPVESKLKEKVVLGRVIVVDDEPEIVDLLKDMLESVDMEVIGTTKPEDVLQLIGEFKPDVVFSDVAMPKVDGYKLLASIRKQYADLPVVFISAHVNKNSLIEAINLGIYSVIEKPFDLMRVIDVCRQAVRKYQLAMLLNSSINLLMYQFSDLDNFLKEQGKDDVRGVIGQEMTEILHRRRMLRQLQKPS